MSKYWQLAQAQLKTKQEKLHTRLDQLQADLKYANQQEEADVSKAKEPAE